MSRAASQEHGGLLAGAEPFIMVAGLVLMTLTVTKSAWLAQALAAVLTGRGWPTGTFSAAETFVVRLVITADTDTAWQQATGRPAPPTGVFWLLWIALLVATGAVAVVVLRRLRTWHSQRPAAGASWAQRAEEQRIAVPEDPARRPGRIVAGRSQRTKSLLAGDDCISATVFGPNGSGKTLGLVVPAALEWDGPCVVSTAKGRDLQWLIEGRARYGPVWVIAPEGVEGITRAHWSPVAYATDDESADRMARWLCESSGLSDDPRARPWVLKARAMVGPVLMAAHLSGGGAERFYRWCLDGQDVRHEVRAILTEHDYMQMADNYDSVWRLHPDGIGSVLFTAAAVVDAYANPRVRASATTSDFTAADLIDQRGTVCIVAPPSQADTLAPMFTALIASIIYEAEKRYEKGGPLNPRLLLDLDEAGNVFRYPQLPTLLTTARGMGIQLLTVWHDLAQLQTRYGQEAARTILSQSKMRLLLPGVGDMSTLEYFSKMLGHATVSRAGSSTDSEGRHTSSTNVQKDELAPIHALQQLTEWHALLQYANLRPMRITMRRVFDDPALLALTRPAKTP
ncbi:type IV secretory system conjugative DNA transfer family protein [Sphaerisporangium album]|uniref:Type IV secretory system conjugative DNA transfer family protein n=1 Tax=Sphaerisporangium album TaxID=509200 RepID=A0A367EJE6_9ACTN|nr:type IV secretory system conjugative DNA transfer family protein [Sphaerisporangium album]RCG18238.1 type IV secretory system conjugative DNA transfer family protein [Sphaerisporangium album]